MAQAAETELQIVRRASATSRRRAVRAVVILVNRLGDGWLYLLIGLAVFLRLGPAGLRVIAAAGLAAAVSHLIYALVKRRVKRLRPFERDATIASVARVLDRYSFPSGHCMTVAAVAVPVVVAVPAWRVPALAGMALIALCRLLAGHHYPSDIATGALLGLAVSVPVALYLIPVAL